LVVADRIRMALAQKVMTQARLAERVGVHPVTVTRWLTSGKSIPLPRLRRVAEVLEVSVEYLLGQSDTPQDRRAPAAQRPQDPVGVPWGLVQVMLSVEDHVTLEEFDHLRDIFDPQRGARSDQAYGWTAGVWFDVLTQLRGFRVRRAGRRSSPSSGESPAARGRTEDGGLPDWLDPTSVPPRGRR
jgi:transcriptional regulator with XRE-family HTH domain